MITGISIENFKGIREKVELEFRPITLLFGANSAGKSTILHALHFAREIFERRNLDAEKTICGGQYVDLGGFESFVHGHDKDRQVTIGISIKDEQLIDLLDEIDGIEIVNEHLQNNQNLAGDATSFGTTDESCVEVTISWSYQSKEPYVSRYRIFYDGELFAEIQCDGSQERVVLAKLEIYHKVLSSFDHLESESEFASVPINEMHADRHSTIFSVCYDEVGQQFQRLKFETTVDDDRFQPILIQNQRDALPTGRLELVRTDDPNGSEIPLNLGLGKAFQAGLSRLITAPIQLVNEQLQKLRYLGPLRETPPRNYHPPRYSDSSRWSSGLGAWDALYNGEDELIDSVGEWLGDPSKLNSGCGVERRTYFELDHADPVVRKIINRRAFDDVEQGEGIDLIKTPTISRVVVVPEDSDIELRPHDVGIGISQVVPVVVTALDGNDRLLAIEQPELHMHPRLQANIADLFVEAFHKNKHNFILETHSEHLILRLLRRIRESEKGSADPDRKLRTSDLAIYFLQQEQGGTKVSRIDVDVKGEFIQPWPDDFFEIDFNERFGIDQDNGGDAS